jgi:hypothetical protein
VRCARNGGLAADHETLGVNRRLGGLRLLLGDDRLDRRGGLIVLERARVALHVVTERDELLDDLLVVELDPEGLELFRNFMDTLLRHTDQLSRAASLRGAASNLISSLCKPAPTRAASSAPGSKGAALPRKARPRAFRFSAARRHPAPHSHAPRPLPFPALSTVTCPPGSSTRRTSELFSLFVPHPMHVRSGARLDGAGDPFIGRMAELAPATVNTQASGFASPPPPNAALSALSSARSLASSRR